MDHVFGLFLLIWFGLTAAQSEVRKRWSNFPQPNCAPLIPFPFHPECSEVHRAGTPRLLSAARVCSAPPRVHLSLYAAVSVQRRVAYSETKEAQKVRLWRCRAWQRFPRRGGRPGTWVAGMGWSEAEGKGGGRLGWPREGDTCGLVEVTRRKAPWLSCSLPCCLP